MSSAFDAITLDRLRSRRSEKWARYPADVLPAFIAEMDFDAPPAVERVLAELRNAGPRASRHAKRLVLDRPDGPETARRIAERRTSDEGQEGLRAFLERRSPDWA